MKTFFTACLTVACLAGARGQGTVDFNNHVMYTTLTRVYLGGDHQVVGDGSNEYSDTSLTPGTTDWSGYTPLLGTNYMAQLLARNGVFQPESTLLQAVPVTTFRTAT